MTDRKFPIGQLVLKESYSGEELEEFVRIIETIGVQYRSMVENLPDTELARTYREGSWNVRQLIHHVADMQYLHYFRMKKAITEADYKEVTLIDMNAWAATADSLTAPIAPSLFMLEGVLQRHSLLIRTLTEEQLSIRYFHPVRSIWFDQKQAIAMTVWHVRHHLAHIGLALE